MSGLAGFRSFDRSLAQHTQKSRLAAGNLLNVVEMFLFG
jgi:hypothetical protein